jgi:hypothetical protein
MKQAEAVAEGFVVVDFVFDRCRFNARHQSLAEPSSPLLRCCCCCWL